MSLTKNLQGILCCVGGFFLCLTFSLDYSYANLNTYVTSYMRKNGHNPNLAYKDFIFLTAAKQFIQGIFMFAGGMLSLKLGVRRSIILGCAILCAGYSLTYFTIDSVFPLVVFSVGCCHGFGFIFVYAIAIGTAQKWFPDNIGLMGSIVVSGYGFGSLIWIPAVTAFVNPDNIEPAAPVCLMNITSGVECEEVKENYFTDPQLLERVPYSFLLMGGIIAALSVIGIILTKEPPPTDIEIDSKKTTTTEIHSLTPVEVLKTRIFYLIWLGSFSISFSQGLLVNWQKTFGLTLVTSDYYHANIGIITSLCNGFSRILWGFLYDKLGYRTCMLIIGVCAMVVIPSLPLLSLLEKNSLTVKLLWGLMMVIFYSTFPGIYALGAAGTRSAFGPKYYAANFGLFFSTTVVYNILLIIFSQVSILLETLDYSGMFFLAGATGVVGNLAIACLPKTLKVTK